MDVRNWDWVTTEFVKAAGFLDTHSTCVPMHKAKVEAKDPQIIWMGQREMVWIWEVERRNQSKRQIPNQKRPTDPVNKDKVKGITASTT